MSVEIGTNRSGRPTRFQLAFYGRGPGNLCRLGVHVLAGPGKGSPEHPATGAFVLAPVHRSNVDTILMACEPPPASLYGQGQPVEEAVVGMGCSLPSAVFRSSWDGGSRGAASRRGGDPSGEALVIFPEGTRRTGTWSGPL